MIISIMLLQLALPIQYGGPPMWDRGPNPEYRRERPMPQPRRYGPQMGRGPRPEYRVPRYPGPPDRYDMYEGE